jgi:hypothetical protein
MSRAVAAETGMPSEVAPGVRTDTTDRVLGLAVAAEPPVWDLEAEDRVVAVVVVVGGAGRELNKERNPGA